MRERQRERKREGHVQCYTVIIRIHVWKVWLATMVGRVNVRISRGAQSWLCHGTESGKSFRRTTSGLRGHVCREASDRRQTDDRRWFSLIVRKRGVRYVMVHRQSSAVIDTLEKRIWEKNTTRDRRMKSPCTRSDLVPSSRASTDWRLRSSWKIALGTKSRANTILWFEGPSFQSNRKASFEGIVFKFESILHTFERIKWSNTLNVRETSLR